MAASEDSLRPNAGKRESLRKQLREALGKQALQSLSPTHLQRGALEGLGLSPLPHPSGAKQASPKSVSESEEVGNGAQSLLVPGQQCGHDIWSLGCPSQLYTQALHSRGRSRASRIKDALDLSSKVFQRFNSLGSLITLILERGSPGGECARRGVEEAGERE